MDLHLLPIPDPPEDVGGIKETRAGGCVKVGTSDSAWWVGCGLIRGGERERERERERDRERERAKRNCSPLTLPKSRTP